MDQQIINLFDEYTHKPLTRQDFLNKLARLTGGMASAMAILPLLEVNYAQAQQVPESDPSITAKNITFPAEGLSMKGYLVTPSGKGKFGSVVVIHENRGLNPHIRDVARRVAKAGFIALAPDALSEAGGTPSNEDQARELIGKLDPQKNLSNFNRAFEFLKKQEKANQKVGCVGFCWGGAMVNQIAVSYPALDAGSSFYGRQPELSEVPKIKAELQLHYAEHDERVNQGIAPFEEALKTNKIKYELFMYKDAQHAFHNDTAPTRFNEQAAKLAWERTIGLFNRKLK